MAAPMLIVLAILAGAVALWSWGRPRADIVGILVVVALLLSGVLTPQESFAGFGDPVVILIAAVFIVGAALENTGIVHRLSLALVRLGGGNEARLIVLVMLIVGALTAFMSSTAVTAITSPTASPLDIGYRWLDIDYKTDGGDQPFAYDVLTQGPVVGFGSRF